MTRPRIERAQRKRAKYDARRAAEVEREAQRVREAEEREVAAQKAAQARVEEVQARIAAYEAQTRSEQEARAAGRSSSCADTGKHGGCYMFNTEPHRTECRAACRLVKRTVEIAEPGAPRRGRGFAGMALLLALAAGGGK